MVEVTQEVERAISKFIANAKIEGARLAIEAISLIIHDQDRETVAALDPAKIVGEG